MSSQQLVNLRIDFAFKQLFGTSGNEDILIAFLNAMLQDSLESPIVSLQFADPHLHREHEEDKLSILDIRYFSYIRHRNKSQCRNTTQ